MGQVLVKFDNQLSQSDIIIPIMNSSHDEMGQYYTGNQPGIQQSLIHGIQAPLIQINDIVIDYSDVLYFELKSDNVLPTLMLRVLDRKKLITSISTPGVDNTIRVQILPKFDDKYKKINLTFSILRFELNQNMIIINAKYKAPQLTSSKLKSFGKLNTYALFEKIAMDTQLGFATNIEASDLDNRYVYCMNISYLKLLDREIKKSGYDMQILDYWIDWWNNIVLTDMYDRYNTIEPDENMKIWLAARSNAILEGEQIESYETVALFNNHPLNQNTELFVKDYKIISNTSQYENEGSDNVFGIYEINRREHTDHLIMDGDKHNDVVSKLEYTGELYGDYNYALQERKRRTFLKKINTNQNIEITLNTPILGVMRGDKINFTWFVNDTYSQIFKDNLAEAGVIIDNANILTNAPIIEQDIPNDNIYAGQFIVDKSISGQYLVTKNVMIFENQTWYYKLTLARPTADVPKIIN